MGPSFINTMTNNEIKRIQSLERGKSRREYGQFLIEGKRLVQAALEWRAGLDVIYFTDPFRRENTEWLQSIESSGVSYENIPTKQLEKISFTKSPSGIVAVCNLPEQQKPDLNQNRWLYLDRIADPGNMGTILRSAAWFDLNHVALSVDCVDPFNPKVVRAGMGAHFGLSIHSNLDLGRFSKTHTLIGGDHRGADAASVEIPECCVLVLGSEAHGLSSDSLEMINQKVAIEKMGFGESLNVGSAAAILMYLFTNK